MAYSANAGGDYRDYINPYDNAVVSCYISEVKQRLNIKEVRGANENSILLIDLEALCSPKGFLERTMPVELGRLKAAYSKVICKNMGSIRRINSMHESLDNYVAKGGMTLYLAGNTNIKSFLSALNKSLKNIYVAGRVLNIWIDRTALRYSEVMESNAVSVVRSSLDNWTATLNITIGNPPAQPVITKTDNAWIKVNGKYLPAINYIKIAHEWRPVRNVYKKVNGVWKKAAAMNTYFFCDVGDERGNSWLSGTKRGGFCDEQLYYCYAEDTNIIRVNEIFFARFEYPPLEGHSSKRCFICNGMEKPRYELLNAAAIGPGVYKIQFTGSVFKIIS